MGSNLAMKVVCSESYCQLTNESLVEVIGRGYLDGEMLTTFRRKYKINWIISLKKNMSAYDDAALPYSF